MSKNNNYIKSKKRRKFENYVPYKKAKQISHLIRIGKNRKKNIIYRKLS